MGIRRPEDCQFAWPRLDLLDRAPIGFVATSVMVPLGVFADWAYPVVAKSDTRAAAVEIATVAARRVERRLPWVGVSAPGEPLISERASPNSP